MTHEQAPSSDDLVAQLLAYRQTLLRCGYKLTGNWHDAEDLTQATYLQAMRKLGQLLDTARPKRWLLEIQLNLFRDGKKKKDLLKVPLDEDVLPVPRGSVEPPDADWLRCILGKAEGAREELVLVGYETDWNYAEMAADLDMEPRSVASKMSNLRDWLWDYVGLLPLVRAHRAYERDPLYTEIYKYPSVAAWESVRRHVAEERRTSAKPVARSLFIGAADIISLIDTYEGPCGNGFVASWFSEFRAIEYHYNAIAKGDITLLWYALREARRSCKISEERDFTQHLLRLEQYIKDIENTLRSFKAGAI